MRIRCLGLKSYQGNWAWGGQKEGGGGGREGGESGVGEVGTVNPPSLLRSIAKQNQNLVHLSVSWPYK